jgi:hypothetical protein
LEIIVMKALHRKFSMPATILAATVLVGGNDAAAQTATAIPPSITTPDKVESSIGTAPALTSPYRPPPYASYKRPGGFFIVVVMYSTARGKCMC